MHLLVFPGEFRLIVLSAIQANYRPMFSFLAAYAVLKILYALVVIEKCRFETFPHFLLKKLTGTKKQEMPTRIDSFCDLVLVTSPPSPGRRGSRICWGVAHT